MFGSILAAHCQIFSSCAHSSGCVFIALVGPSPAIPSLSLKTLSLKVFFVKVLSLMLPPLSRFCAKETPYLSLSKSFKVSQSPPMSQESRVGRNSIKRTENDKCVCVWKVSLVYCIVHFDKIFLQNQFILFVHIHQTMVSHDQDQHRTSQNKIQVFRRILRVWTCFAFRLPRWQQCFAPVYVWKKEAHAFSIEIA